MGASFAKQMRSPETGTCMGWMAQKIMSSGSGVDSVDAVAALKLAVETPTIIELGPGAGYAMRSMISSFSPSRFYGIEISDAFRQGLSEDTEFAELIEKGVLSLHGDDAKDLNFVPDNSVDLIFAHNVIYFLDPLDIYLNEAYRVLKPGGQAFFGVKEMAKTLDQSIYINTDWGACLEAMKKAGFEDVEQKESRLEGGLAYIPLVCTKK
jgi:ubiquinone/menaquinone biosynthesis C-methylase UbiE